MADEIQPPAPREFYRTIKEQWFIAMASGIGVLAWATGAIFPMIGAVQVIQIAAMMAVILSAYHIWAQERTKLVAALGQLARSESETPRDKVLRLAKELEQFAEMQRTIQPHYSALWEPTSATHLAHVTHLNDTAQSYSTRFLERVNGVRDELSEHGIVDELLDDANLNPSLVKNIQRISNRLTALADRLPGVGASD